MNSKHLYIYTRNNTLGETLCVTYEARDGKLYFKKEG